jgi:hypothetical protein
MVSTEADGMVFIVGGAQGYSPLNWKAYPGATVSCGQLTIYTDCLKGCSGPILKYGQSRTASLLCNRGNKNRSNCSRRFRMDRQERCDASLSRQPDRVWNTSFSLCCNSLVLRSALANQVFVPVAESRSARFKMLGHFWLQVRLLYGLGSERAGWGRKRSGCLQTKG